MAVSTDRQRPAQVAGDAEAPPASEQDRTAKDAVTHSDPTEPTQAQKGQTKQQG